MKVKSVKRNAAMKSIAVCTCSTLARGQFGIKIRPASYRCGTRTQILKTLVQPFMVERFLSAMNDLPLEIAA
ncbi:hypothetical protein [Rhodoferax sp.]|uniref:hypothetical protein n=1 Tax=Rhodoferax sp. TaxID=50421 RepID=UPI001ED78885|nr:hypothetical protein [Rhodoferax sp.]MBT9508248.1 hypothetical protein [Rhodoferax sp.]